MRVDADKIKLIETMGGNRKHVLTKVVLPSNIPNLFSIMKVDIGLCLVGVIIGEFISSRRGLGYMIIYGSQIFKLDWIILGIVILCVIAMGLYQAIVLLEKWYLKH
jgi:NitT/TauT family transport system permease protein